VAAALDGGATEVELVDDDDLARAVAAIGMVEPGANVLIGALPNARPFASAAARITAAFGAGPRTVSFVCAAAGGELSVDGIYVSGLLTRLLLEEFVGPAMLTDAAGLGVSLGGTYAHPRAVLESSERVRALDGAAVESSIKRAAQIDTLGAVGVVRAPAQGERVPSVSRLELG
jgi:phosphosulfolactate phosphohydrolase-like enzyme